MKKASDKIQRIGLTTNPEKTAARQLIRRIARELQKAGRSIVVDATTAPLLETRVQTVPDLPQLSAATDLLFPPRCVACGGECESRAGEAMFCVDCDERYFFGSR